MTVDLVRSDDDEYLFRLASDYSPFSDDLRLAWWAFGSLRYDVYVGGVRVGVLFSLEMDGVATFDAYSEITGGKAAIAGLIASKMFLKELFKKHDVIYTMHKISERNLTAICKRLGFIASRCIDNNILMELRHGG